jgi:magnesium-transporting ATPase (P-type)
MRSAIWCASCSCRVLRPWPLRSIQLVRVSCTSRPDAQILSVLRLSKLLALGTTMAVGTLAVLWYSLDRAPPEYALTLGFTTFVLFQVFNVFNARAERGTSFDRRFFDSRLLWLSLAWWSCCNRSPSIGALLPSCLARFL